MTKPPPSFDAVRAAILQTVGNRFAPPADDDLIRAEIYQPLLKWVPSIVAYQEMAKKTELPLLDQALRPLRQRRARLAARLKTAEKAEPPTFRATSRVFTARVELQQADAVIATLARDRQITGVEGWTWLWEVLPAAIERMMRPTNPQYPRSGRRTEGKTEREYSLNARIMAALLPLFGVPIHSTAGAIEKELQRLAKLKAAILDLHDQGQTMRQIADALAIDPDEANRVLVRDGRI